MIIDFKKYILKRIGNNQEIIFDFKNNTCNIENNEFKTEFKINVLKLNVLFNYFYVQYLIENDNFELEIKII